MKQWHNDKINNYGGSNRIKSDRPASPKMGKLYGERYESNRPRGMEENFFYSMVIKAQKPKIYIY